MGSSFSRNSMKATNKLPLQLSGSIEMTYNPFPLKMDLFSDSDEDEEIIRQGRSSAAYMDWVAKDFRRFRKTTINDEVGSPSFPVHQETSENGDIGAHEKPSNTTEKTPMDENQTCSGTNSCESGEESFNPDPPLQCHSIHIENMMSDAILRSKSFSSALRKLSFFRKLAEESAPPHSQRENINGNFRANIQGLDTANNDGPQRNREDWINRLEFSHIHTQSGCFYFKYHLGETYATGEDLVQEMNEVMNEIKNMVDRMIDHGEESFRNYLNGTPVKTNVRPSQANAPLFDMNIPVGRNIRPPQADTSSINGELDKAIESPTYSQHANLPPNNDDQFDKAIGPPQNEGRALVNNTTLMDENQLDEDIGPQAHLQNAGEVIDDLFEEVMESLEGNKFFTRELLSANI